MNLEEKIRNIERKKENFSKDELLVKDFQLYHDDKLSIYAAPFDYVNIAAKIVIIGITPGWQQMQKSFDTAKNLLNQNVDWAEALRIVKQEASFAGTMRNNLISMLDDVGLNTKLQLESCSKLFCKDNYLLHSTSYLKQPVFYKESNYSGKTPSPIENPLWQYVENYFIREMQQFQNVLIIPLGVSVKRVLIRCSELNKLKPNVILEEFPHPSNQNRQRITQFTQHKMSIAKKIEEWTC